MLKTLDATTLEAQLPGVTSPDALCWVFWYRVIGPGRTWFFGIDHPNRCPENSEGETHFGCWTSRRELNRREYLTCVLLRKSTAPQHNLHSKVLFCWQTNYPHCSGI